MTIKKSLKIFLIYIDFKVLLLTAYPFPWMKIILIYVLIILLYCENYLRPVSTSYRIGNYVVMVTPLSFKSWGFLCQLYLGIFKTAVNNLVILMLVDEWLVVTVAY